MDEQPDPAAVDQPAPPARKRGAGWVVAGVVVIALCAIGFLARPDTGGDAEYSAKIACRDFVKQRLKAPATADFTDEVVNVDGQTYSVTGNVDAENSFGAKLRQTYTCVLEDAGSEWRLTALTGL